MTRRSHKEAGNSSSVGRATSALEEIRAFLSLDPYFGDFGRIADRVRALDQRQSRAHLLKLCDSALRSPDIAKNEPMRVAVARVLFALVPD